MAPGLNSRRRGDLALMPGRPGAYTSAQLTVKLGLPFLAGFLLGGLLAALAAFVVGRVILRLKGVYFLLFTFALSEFLFLLSKNATALTGGNTGVVGIKPPALPFLAEPLRSKAAFYYLALVVLALGVAFVAALYRSPFGRAMNAVRESELLAAATGYNPMRIKVIAFSIGCLLAGFGGSLFAHFLHIALSFTFWNANFLLMNTWADRLWRPDHRRDDHHASRSSCEPTWLAAGPHGLS